MMTSWTFRMDGGQPTGLFFSGSCVMHFFKPPTEGLATEGACGVITVTGDGQGLGQSWSGVTRVAGDTARRVNILAASVSVMTPRFRIMTYVILCTRRGWV